MTKLGRFIQSFPKAFWVMALGSVVFCASFQMVLPNMPDYIASLGGEKYKGYYISLFALMALISRPFSGILTDRIGRKPVMIFGALICIIASLGYLWAMGFVMVLFMRFIHGMATGFTPTGATAYTADLAPKGKTGIAMGIMGLSNNLGMALGPIIGGYIFNKLGFSSIFITSASVGLLAIFIFRSLPETALGTQRFKFSSLKINLNDFYEPKVYGPFLVTLAGSFAFGTFLTITPAHSKLLNIANLGTAFTIMTLSSLVTRIYAAHLSDILGRIWVLRISLSLLTLTVFLLGYVQNLWSYYLLCTLWGLSQGASSPTAFAWTTDIALLKNKGRAFATVFIGLELGIILGGYFTGYCQNLDLNLSFIYSITGVVLGSAALFTWFSKIDFTKRSLHERNDES